MSNIPEDKTLLTELARARSRSLLTHSLLHDFSNAMGGAGSLAETIADSLPENDNLKEDLDLIKETVFRGQKILRDLVEVNRDTEGEISCFNLSSYLRNLEPILQGVLPRHSVLNLNLPTEEIPVSLDPLDLRHALILVMGRCRKKGRDPIAAEVHLFAENGFAVIQMTCGSLKKEEMDKFQQLFELEDQFIKDFALRYNGSYSPITDQDKPGYEIKLKLHLLD